MAVEPVVRRGWWILPCLVALAFPVVAAADELLWPVVDCSKLLQNAHDQEAAEAIGSALLTRGFFFAKNVLAKDTLAHVYEASRHAHGLSVEEKLLYARHGYTGPDVNAEELAYESTKRSTVRAWDYAKEENSFVPTDTRYPGDLEAVASQLYDQQATIGKALLTAMALGLGLPADTFAQHTTGELGSLRLLRYPPVTTDEDDLIGVSAHTDFEVFTLMHQDALGLQVRALNSTAWEDAPIVDDALLVIVGDVLERMTNGVLQATPHRVLPKPYERYAIIRFNAFAADTIIEPMPEFCSESHPAAYSPTTMSEIMRTVISNLEAGKGAWDKEADRSTTAGYDYRTCFSDDNAASCS
jgi:isopenicillin N synthase-like dioxygenase